MNALVTTIVVLFTVLVCVQVIGWLSQLGVFLHRYFGLYQRPNLYALYGGSTAEAVDTEDTQETATDATADTTPTTPETATQPDAETKRDPTPTNAETTNAETTNTMPTTPETAYTTSNPVWVVITGGSSGQGRAFALQFADLGFGIVLIGSARSHGTAEMVRAKGVPCVVIVKDLGQAFQDSFFDDIADTLAPLDVAVLVNNVGHRTGWMPFHEAPTRCLRETVACGTMVQTRLTHLLLPKLLRRLERTSTIRSAVIFITAQCLHPNTGFAIAGFVNNEISVPYLATYEASNAYGFYHACSLIHEYANVDRLDMLNITPGAVLTENTAHVLKDAPFSVSGDQFVKNILTFLGGNVENGTTCAHWGHALSNALVGFAPWQKAIYLDKVGKSIATDYMERYAERAERYGCADDVHAAAKAVLEEA